ncbi:amino acid ABC transporter substrate-binding protein [candidate division WWE3 bacterium]|nr:amino acid ABC transporter substrate-binding protein [candidate division WWE3 bacterium]
MENVPISDTQPQTLPQTSQVPSQTVPSQTVPSKPNVFKFTLWLIPALIIILVVGIFWALQIFKQQTDIKDTSSVGPHIAEIKQRGTLLIGTDATFPPMEYLDDTNVLTGYDIDFGNRIAAELGVTAEFKNIVWDDLFLALENKEIDVIISSVTITDERKNLYSFSEPYINAGQVIITQKTNSTISRTSDLNGKKIGVQKETTNEQEAIKYTPDKYVVRYDDFQAATQALIDGAVDAIFSDLTNAKGIVKSYPDLKIASDPFTSEFYGIVMRQNEEDLGTELDRAVGLLQQRGILTLLKQKWLD